METIGDSYFNVDEVRSDKIRGWFYSKSKNSVLSVIIQSNKAITLKTKIYRSDVADFFKSGDAKFSGFEFIIPQKLLQTTSNKAKIEILLDDHVVATYFVPVLEKKVKDTNQNLKSPFIPQLNDLLISFKAEYSDNFIWNIDTIDQALSDLEFLLDKGPPIKPKIHQYFYNVYTVWNHIKYVEKFFPRVNSNVCIDSKDYSSIQNTPDEIFAICLHYITLNYNGIIGDLVEFGCFKGYSSSIFSFVCNLLNTNLICFDSFEGLPKTTSDYYNQGEFCGNINEVKENIRNFGNLSSVSFQKGFFDTSVPNFNKNFSNSHSISMIYLDVDLLSSASDALNIFPLLNTRGALFSHECPSSLFDSETLNVINDENQVLPAILNAYKKEELDIASTHIFGNTGAFWSRYNAMQPFPFDMQGKFRHLISKSLGYKVS